MARNYSSVVESKTLTSNVSSVATQITLNNVTGLPSRPYVLVLNPDTANEEAVLVTSDQTGVTSPTLKVTRAIETGASAKTHTTGDTVRHMIVGTDLQIVHDHTDNTTTAHGINNKAPLASPTFTGTVVLPSTTSIGTITSTELGYVDGVTSAIQTQLNTNTPVGSMIMWATSTPPTGWLLCDGQSTSGYTALAAVVGANVPDLRGRIPMGAGTGTGLTARTLGTQLGVESVTLTSAQSGSPSHDHGVTSVGGGGHTATGSISTGGHGHTLTMEFSGTASHDHAISGISNPRPAMKSDGTGSGTITNSDGTAVAGVGDLGGSASVGVADHGHSIDITPSTATDAAAAHTNIQPSTVVNFIIKH
jgi:microcystin-dependent protein